MERAWLNVPQGAKGQQVPFQAVLQEGGETSLPSASVASAHLRNISARSCGWLAARYLETWSSWMFNRRSSDTNW